MICFITGGARSGKSKYAQEAALSLSRCPVYVATAVYNSADPEFGERVELHRQNRDGRWTNFEEPLVVSRLPLENRTVVIDCVTLWLSNLFTSHKYDSRQSLQGIQEEIDSLNKINASFFIISNEIGMGLHADSEIGRKFTDLQGWANQYIAGISQKVVLMVSGIPVVIKNNEP